VIVLCIGEGAMPMLKKSAGRRKLMAVWFDCTKLAGKDEF
jgi:hypothetical protein